MVSGGYNYNKVVNISLPIKSARVLCAMTLKGHGLFRTGAGKSKTCLASRVLPTAREITNLLHVLMPWALISLKLQDHKPEK